MNKLVLLVFAVAVIVQGHPGFSGFNDDLLEAVAAGNWEKVQKLITSGIEQDGSWSPLSSGSVRDLKPVPGGQVYGESEVTFHESSDFNGQKSEKSVGHKVINDNGQISEYDFKPQIPY